MSVATVEAKNLDSLIVLGYFKNLHFSTLAGLVWFTNMAAVTSRENLTVVLFDSVRVKNVTYMLKEGC